MAADAVDPGRASVALTVFNCSADLVFDDCIFEAGLGADGDSGDDGDPGAGGGAGSAGGPGSCDAFVPAQGGLEGGGVEGVAVEAASAARKSRELSMVRVLPVSAGRSFSPWPGAGGTRPASGAS